MVLELILLYGVDFCPHNIWIHKSLIFGEIYCNAIRIFCVLYLKYIFPYNLYVLLYHSSTLIPLDTFLSYLTIWRPLTKIDYLLILTLTIDFTVEFQTRKIPWTSSKDARKLVHTYIIFYSILFYIHNWPLQSFSQNYGLAFHT